MGHGRALSWVDGLRVPHDGDDDGDDDDDDQTYSKPATGCDSSPMWHVLAYRYLL